METLILALGNELMKDDGVGLKVGRLLAEKGYNVLEVGTDIFMLQSHYSGEERLIIIDAILSEKFKPGEIIHVSGGEVFEKLKAEIRSAHFMGAIDGLKLLMALDERLANVEIHFIGIVAKEINLGMELTEEVREALPKAVELVEELVKK
ncbi:hydrogenase-specific maturation endopeptidase [Thermococcus onnurineus NA1]|uniref:Hydrogenase-specific maturation endopeptidase n=1 Tax=Thermococcus onnurineus (strain NA1) TaxID=523850 RepID=B6YU78_THEON|nr:MULTISPECIES: hydrogenase maturation protease [Thermococcus]ACJ16020.1 hydrogenase-specific maturation endopeptidase [Thermococcus onnurineus NA1]NJE46520.1 hydrogenase maturation protease [Thermococcus sp. GR7]NJE77560.1 hydrogenase maturation protease [Thermococcus sp. GR4]NJF23649.1 hydrogenase maturation protease [Thermococcus sp. GR5]